MAGACGPVLVDLLHAGGRMAFRARGARPVEAVLEGARLAGFAFEGPEGAPIVLLHGLGDASTTWHPLVSRLREHAPLLAVDLPPFGRSQLSEGEHLLPREHARLVAQLLEDRIERPATVVGHSMGGWVAQWLAHDAPELVDRVAMLAPGGARLPGSLTAVDLLTPVTVEEARAYLDTLWYEAPPLRELFVRDALERLHRPSIRAFLEHSTRTSTLSPEQLGEIETPGLVVWGHEERLLDPGTPAYLDEHWGVGLEHAYLARAAHMVHHDRPRAVLDRLLDLVARA